MITFGIIFLTSLYLLNDTKKTSLIKGGSLSRYSDVFVEKCKKLICYNPKAAFVVGSYLRLGKENAGDMDIKEAIYDTSRIPDILHKYGLKLKGNLHRIDTLSKISIKYNNGLLVHDPKIHEILTKMGTLNGMLKIVNYDNTLQNIDLSFLSKDKQDVVNKYIKKQTTEGFVKILQLFVVRHNISIDDLINENYYSKDIFRLRVNIIQEGYKIEYGLEFGKPNKELKIDVKDFYSKDFGSINYYLFLKKIHNILKKSYYVLNIFKDDDKDQALKAIEAIEEFRKEHSKLSQDIVKYDMENDFQKMKGSYNKLNNISKELVVKIQKQLPEYLSSFLFTNKSFYEVA